MDVKGLKGRPISAKAREKCIEQARKTVKSYEKWGYWSAVFNILGGVAYFGIGICFIVLLQWVAQLPGIPGQPIQGAMWQGFLLGMIFGFIAATGMYQGVWHIIKGYEQCNGDPASNIIVEYHDALLQLMHDANQSSITSEASMSHETSPSEQPST